MKSISLLFVLFAFFDNGYAHAAGSALRIACEGEDVGAEVYVDGKFRGECPVDIQVPAGTLKLLVQKKIDASHIRLFEQEIRMADDSVKKVEAVLAVQLSAEGRRLEQEAAEKERARQEAEKRRVAEEKRRSDEEIAQKNATLLEELKKRGIDAGNGKSFSDCPNCLEMLMQIKVGDSVWKAISNSDQYRNAPKMRAYKVDTGDTLTLQSSSKVVNEKQIIGVPVGDKCRVSRTKTHTHYFSFGSGMDTNLDQLGFECGSIIVGMVINGKQALEIKTINITGSLFPMHEGAESSIHTEYMNHSVVISCRVTGKTDANSLDPRLTGNAWIRHCKSELTYATPPMKINSEAEDYFIENLGFTLSTIGVVNPESKKYFLPKPGDSTVAFGIKGERLGSTRYDRHEWSLGE